MANKYLYGLPDGKVYKDEAGTLVEIGDKPVTGSMFDSDGNIALNMSLVQATPYISVYFYSDLETVYGSKLNATAVYKGKTVKQLDDFIVPSLSKVLFTTPSLPANATFRMLFSVDTGSTWFTQEGGIWVEVPIEDISTRGMPPNIVAGIQTLQWDELLLGSDTLRLAYYLEQATAIDRLLIEQIRVNF